MSSGFTLRVCHISCTADMMHMLYIIAQILSYYLSYLSFQTFYRHKNNIEQKTTQEFTIQNHTGLICGLVAVS